MVIIKTYQQGELVYEKGCEFAQNEYWMQSGVRLNPNPELLCVAQNHGQIIGCFGLHTGNNREKLMTEQFFPLLEQVVPEIKTKRQKVAELGTFAITQCANSKMVSLALLLGIVLAAHKQNISIFLFTANPAVGALAKLLGVEMIDLGQPNTNMCDQIFHQNWQQYFTKQRKSFVVRANSKQLKNKERLLTMFNKQNYQFVC